MCGRAKLPDDVSEIKIDLKIDFGQIGDCAGMQHRLRSFRSSSPLPAAAFSP